MLISDIELTNFRNYKKVKIKLNNGINIFYGDNAQGKTINICMCYRKIF